MTEQTLEEATIYFALKFYDFENSAQIKICKSEKKKKQKFVRAPMKRNERAGDYRSK